MQKNNLKLKKIICFGLLIPILALSLSARTFPTAKAEASAISLGIDPPLIIVNAIPPTTAVNSFNIQNKSDTQITLQVQLRPFKAGGENGEAEYLRDAPPIFGNIQILDADVPVEKITLSPKQQKTLNLNINIPQDTSISDYYFSVIFISTDTPPTESNSSVNQAGIATNVLLSIGEKEVPKANLEEFSTNIFFEKGPASFTVRVNNKGAHFIKPKGEITIKNMFGQSVGKLDLFGVNILSGSIRAIPNDAYMQELRLRDGSSAGNKGSSDFRFPTALWKESFLLGFYSATLNISMSDEGPAFTKTIHFFAFPLQGFIMIAVFAIAIIVIRKRLKLYMNKNRT